jgi:hypothetical protein
VFADALSLKQHDLSRWPHEQGNGP